MFHPELPDGMNIRHGAWTAGQTADRQMLLRKEVIQPHLPVRLPCYDFVPITGFALDGWPPRGSPRRLQAPPAFMT